MADLCGKDHFLDREHETRRVEEALRSRKSLIITGPAEIGKTALIRHVLADLPAEIRVHCLYLSGFKNLQDLLRKLLVRLNQAGNPALLRQLRIEGIPATNFEAWVKAVPSPRLKGTLYRAVAESHYRLILDHCPPLTQAIAKVIKELFWMRSTSVCLLVRDEGRQRIEQFSHFFYWGRRERMALGPLPKPAARAMLEECIARFRLSKLDLDGFRREILNFSGGVPGAIVKMCALAVNERYQYGRRIKTELIYIDYLMGQSVHTTAPLTRRVRRPRPAKG